MAGVNPYPHELLSLGRHSYIGGPIITNIPVTVGHFTSIASGLRIVSGQHPSVVERAVVSNFPFEDFFDVAYVPSKMDGSVYIGSDVWIGEGVTLLDGVSINDGAIVGAGAVVAKDVDPYAVVVGNPAYTVRSRFSSLRIVKLRDLRWWNWDDAAILEAVPIMQDIDLFLERYGSDQYLRRQGGSESPESREMAG